MLLEKINGQLYLVVKHCIPVEEGWLVELKELDTQHLMKFLKEKKQVLGELDSQLLKKYGPQEISKAVRSFTNGNSV